MRFLVLMLLSFTASAEITMTWDLNDPAENVTGYNVYRSEYNQSYDPSNPDSTPWLPYAQVALQVQPPWTDSTHPADNCSQWYVTATAPMGAESQASNPLTNCTFAPPAKPTGLKFQ